MSFGEDIGISAGIKPSGDTGLLGKKKRKQEEDVEIDGEKETKREIREVVGST
jgi:hypothetical protein